MSEPVEVQVEKLTPQPGDVLVMKAVSLDSGDPADMPVGGRFNDPLDVLTQWVSDRQLDGVLIVALAADQEFARLDPVEMRRNGWVRADALEAAYVDGRTVLGDGYTRETPAVNAVERWAGRLLCAEGIPPEQCDASTSGDVCDACKTPRPRG